MFLLSVSVHSQDALWGFASEDGPKGAGTAFTLSTKGTNYKIQAKFSQGPLLPYGNLTKGPSGYLYGMTASGGDYHSGTIFKMKADGTDFTVLRSFNLNSDGAQPLGSLIVGSDGYLYGMTSYDSENLNGLIFKLKPDGTNFIILKKFISATDGAKPKGSLIIHKNGFLYGMTSKGGKNDKGTIFKIALNGNNFTVLKHFDEFSSGSSPEGSLLEESNGKLYGMTTFGGEKQSGTLFSIASDGSNFTVLKSFDEYIDGAYPKGSLIKGKDGYLYGMTSDGGDNRYGSGTIFKVKPDGFAFTVLKVLDNYPDGAQPHGSLLEGRDGYLYSMTKYGGENGLFESGYGSIFKIKPDGTEFTILKYFDGHTDGSCPNSSLIEGEDGSLFGMASDKGGNNSGKGTIFKIASDGTSFAVLENFNYSSSGSFPLSSFIKAKDGYLYGMTSKGGEIGYGAIIKMDPKTAKFTILKSLNLLTDGAYPKGSLIEGSDGYLYGMTTRGGAHGSVSYGGTIFKIKPDGTEFILLKSFKTLLDGVNPEGSLLEDSNGYLYGVNSVGGQFGNVDYGGTIFRLKLDGTEFSVIKSFDPFMKSGNSPFGSLLKGKDGNLYGVTSRGGEGLGGTIFKIKPDGTEFILLKSFNSSIDGDHPNGNLLEDSNGYLYGMARYGGLNLDGTIFRMKVDGSDFTVLKSFKNNIDGAYPMGSLTKGSDGYLYGTASRGGKNNTTSNDGTIFKIKPDGSDFVVLKAFDEFIDGGSPQGDLLLIEGTNTSPAPLKNKIYPNPFEDELNIELAREKTKVLITLYDGTGKMCYQLIEEVKQGKILLNLDKAKLKAGLYVIKLQGEDGFIHIAKAIKSR